MNVSARRSRIVLISGLAALMAFAAEAGAQQPAASSRVLGTVTAVSGTTVTVKTDSGATVDVTVPATAKILKTAPGQKTLAGATPIAVSDIEAGDRVLMLAPGTPPVARIVIVNKKSALLALQQKQREAWQQGVGGLVKSVDVANRTVTVLSGARMVTIHVTPATVLRRYAPNSVKFSEAQPSTLDAIHPGDQLQARGQKSANGAELTADEIVSGSFRNIAGLVQSVDAASGTFKVKDWMSKKTVTIHTTADSDLRQLNPKMEERIAEGLRAGAGQHSGEPGGKPGQAMGGAAHGNGAGGTWPQHAGAGTPGKGSGGPDLARILAESPEIHVGDLHKGDAVVIVATSGSPDSATAIRVVTGVREMLEASASGSQNMFSSAWSLGGGSGSSGGEQEGMGGGGTP